MNPVSSLIPCRGLLAAACLAGALSAQAQPAALPAMKGDGAVRWVCGGIGSDESTAMRGAMKSHPLSLLFARKDGAYLADVDVRIQSAAGAPALTLRANGPVCLVDLPAGRYAVEARTEGLSQKQDVTIGGTPKTADFRF
ncbi:MAG: carboxypeptidase regulatory-like domain-containing protein [Comamonadaceae bacterium]|nr:MAG: carboxypeptidase regulatory-like domain-containing protein [Comamonadaceae bacterium]